MKAEIYDPRYCKKCGGRLAYRYVKSNGSLYEDDVTYRCICRSPEKQIAVRMAQEEGHKAKRESK